MRQFITLALSIGAVATAAAQTQGEVIIRRPGVADRVIKLDSINVKEQIAKLENQLHELTVTSKLRASELPLRVKDLQDKLQINIDGQRSKTLALRDRELASQDFLAPMMRTLESAARRRPLLGITVAVEPRETDKIGAYIDAVTPGSPAAKAGILAGDVIVRIAGKSVNEKDPKANKDGDESGPGMRLIEIISTLTVGKPVDVELRRGTQTVNVKVTPAEDNSSIAIARAVPGMPDIQRIQTGRITQGEFQPMARSLAAPEMNFFTNGTGTFGYSFGNNGLFSNIELTSLNEKLGAYFGATEGVLVVNVGSPRDVVFAKLMPTTGARGGGAGVMIRTDSVSRKTPGAAAGGRGGAMAVPAEPRVTARGGRADSAATYIDGVPMATRRAPVNIPVEPGDVIVSVDGRKVTSPSQLMRIVGSYDHNDEFKLQIVRQKKSETLTIKMP